MMIEQICISPQSNYWSQGKNAPGEAPSHLLNEVECHEGKGLVGDRFYNYKENYRGQITFICKEKLDQMKTDIDVDFSYEVLRRNIVVSGFDPLTLIGKKFRFGDVEFAGIEDCTPCAFWDKAVKPGSHKWLADHQAGGLRAKILSSGKISLGDKIEIIAE